MSALKQKLKTSLTEEDTGANRKRWALKITRKNIMIKDLLDLIDSDRKTAMRFIWMLGDICEIKPALISPVVPQLFKKRNDTLIPNYDRSMAKIFWLSGIPEKIEAEAADVLFKWLMDPKITVSTKVYSISALYNLSLKYPGFKNELKVVIEDQLSKNTVAFDKRAKKILQKLENR